MTTPVAGETHHITIEANNSTYGFMVAPGSLRKERADDFAPRIATGNEPSLREGIWDIWAMRGAAEGVDQLTFINRNKIYRADGNIFLNREELFTLHAAFNSSEVVVATAPMFVDFPSGGTDYVAAGIGTKVRRYNIGAGTWAASTTTLGANSVWLHRHGIYVFAAVGSSVDFYRSTDIDTWTQPAAGEKASCFATWSKNGVVYLVKATGTSFKLSTDNGATWGSAVAVGNPDTNITGLGVAFGLLVIGKEDGIYYYDGTNTVEEVIFPGKKYTNNCKALVYHDGFLYTHVLGRVWKLSFSSGGISNLVDITPEMIGTENRELYGHGIPIWIWAGVSQLFVAFDAGETLYPEVMSYNGVGWHQEFRGTASNAMVGGSYSRLAARTFINCQATFLRRHPNLRDFPYPDYPATGVFETSDFDAGLPNWFKAFRDVVMEVENITAAAGSVQVEYSIDKGVTWVSMGSIINSGVNTLFFPNTEPIAAQKVRLRITITRNSATSAPRIRQFQVAFLNRPSPIYGYSITLKIGPDQIILNDEKESVSMSERMSFLFSAEASKNPVTFTDMHGHAVLAYITKTSQRTLADKPIGNGVEPPEELDFTITLIQAMMGGRWDEVVWDAFLWS